MTDALGWRLVFATPPDSDGKLACVALGDAEIMLSTADERFLPAAARSCRGAGVTIYVRLPSDIAIGAGVRGGTLQQARRFVEFVLSPAGQRVMQRADPDADSNYQPLLQGVPALPAVSRLVVRDPLLLDPLAWGPRQAGVDQWFSSRVMH